MDNQISVPPALTGNYAFFFDLDGTLADIQPHPDQVVIPDSTLQALNALAQQQGGAVALISGRSMAELDALTHPWRLPLAGVHGAERRDINGKTYIVSLPTALRDEIAAELRRRWKRSRDVSWRVKRWLSRSTIARPRSSRAPCWSWRSGLFSAIRCWRYSLASAWWRLNPAASTKGRRLPRSCRRRHRRPRTGFVGDDLTDEAGFSVVNQLQGMSVKVGAGETQAHWRLADAAAVRTWLQHLAYDAQTERRDDHESFSRSL